MNLVKVHGVSPGYMRALVEDKGVGLVTSLYIPPRGSLDTFTVEVLTPTGIINTYRQYLEKIYD